MWLRSSGVWHCVDGYMVQDVSKDGLTFIFLLSKSMKKDREPFKTKATPSFDTSGIGYLWTQRHLTNTEILACTAVRNSKLLVIIYSIYRFIPPCSTIRAAAHEVSTQLLTLEFGIHSHALPCGEFCGKSQALD
jgi:hypothetical protein